MGKNTGKTKAKAKAPKGGGKSGQDLCSNCGGEMTQDELESGSVCKACASQ